MKSAVEMTKMRKLPIFFHTTGVSGSTVLYHYWYGLTVDVQKIHSICLPEMAPILPGATLNLWCSEWCRNIDKVWIF